MIMSIITLTNLLSFRSCLAAKGFGEFYLPPQGVLQATGAFLTQHDIPRATGLDTARRPLRALTENERILMNWTIEKGTRRIRLTQETGMTSEDALILAMCLRGCRGSNDDGVGGLEVVLCRLQALPRSLCWQAALGRQRNGDRGGLGGSPRHEPHRAVDVEWQRSPAIDRATTSVVILLQSQIHNGLCDQEMSAGSGVPPRYRSFGK
jgi:hypothetical protein